VPRRSHDRAIEVRPTPDGLVVRYRLEMDEWTAVFVDVPNLLPADEVRKYSKPIEFYAALTKAVAPLVADKLYGWLDDQPLTFRCVKSDFVVIDSLRCDLEFRADWKLQPGRDHVFAFREGNYESQSGLIDLTLMGDEGVELFRPQAPNAILKGKPPLEWQPGDEEKLRTAKATLRFNGTQSPPVATGGLETSTPAPAPPAEHSSSLLRLLDAPHGYAMLLLLAAAFGAAHALTPGHGKTLVAAYLVGERGTVWHAMILGIVTTITHTGSVLLLAAGLTLWFPGAVPAQVQTVLGFVGGLLVAGLGVWLLLRRLAGQVDHVHVGGGHHHHHHGGHHHHHHEMPNLDGKSVWGQLIVLGVSGGIVPCWDAIAMLGFAIAAQRLWLGVPLLLAFSAGLAGVLVALGITVVYAHGLVGARWGDSKIWKTLPIFSALALIGMGLWLCRDSLPPPGG
jgi:ABC-type nickel/cobalt efflux system permease component RcnA